MENVLKNENIVEQCNISNNTIQGKEHSSDNSIVLNIQHCGGKNSVRKLKDKFLVFRGTIKKNSKNTYKIKILLEKNFKWQFLDNLLPWKFSFTPLCSLKHSSVEQIHSQCAKYTLSEGAGRDRECSYFLLLFSFRGNFFLLIAPCRLGVQSDLKLGEFWRKTWQVYFLSSSLVFEIYLPAKKSILADQMESLVVKVLDLLFIQGEQVRPFAHSQGLRIRRSVVATCSQRALFGSPSTSLFCPSHLIQSSGAENGSYLAVPSKPILSYTQSFPTICNIKHQRKLSLYNIFFYLEVAPN